MQKIDFKKHKYDTDLIIGTFGLKHGTQCALLDALLDTTGAIAERYVEDLEMHRVRLKEEGKFWNEEELKMHFISPIFFLAKIDVPQKIKLFYERILKNEVEGQDIFVKCDCMIATPFGVNTPQAPYFFLQQLKKKFSPLGERKGGY